jgi:cation diffusion facilitator CzcD-associated flavoprotein CzcO
MQKQDFDIAIIGAGFAGIGMAMRLKKAGFDSFVLFERAAQVGGTWRDNTYPGCGCDVHSHLYSYSFELNPQWSLQFSKQPEILAYLLNCVQKYGLAPHLRLNTEIVEVLFSEQEGLYHISDQLGQTHKVRLVISALGPLNRPQVPELQGMETFEGPVFHSSNWRHDLDLKGKKVAVIGTGASAIQFVPELAKVVAKLSVFQRTPPYITPKPDAIISEKTKALFQRFPGLMKLRRECIFWFNELIGLGIMGNKSIGKLAHKEALDHLNAQVKDPVLRQKLTPDYEIGCKRILVSNDYYPALQLEQVDLICDGIAEIQPRGLLTKAGAFIETEVIIFGTGFHVSAYPEQFVKNFKVLGLQGRDLFKQWSQTGFEAYKGTSTHGFPNLLFLLGPNTGLGHNSVIHIMESQMTYILDYYQKLRAMPPGTYFDVKTEVQTAYNRALQTQFKDTAWASGCQSYYLSDGGKNTTLFPRTNTRFRCLLKKMDLGDYEISPIAIEKR